MNRTQLLLANQIKSHPTVAAFFAIPHSSSAAAAAAAADAADSPPLPSPPVSASPPSAAWGSRSRFAPLVSSPLCYAACVQWPPPGSRFPRLVVARGDWCAGSVVEARRTVGASGDQRGTDGTRCFGFRTQFASAAGGISRGSGSVPLRSRTKRSSHLGRVSAGPSAARAVRACNLFDRFPHST